MTSTKNNHLSMLIFFFHSLSSAREVQTYKNLNILLHNFNDNFKNILLLSRICVHVRKSLTEKFKIFPRGYEE